MHAKLDSATTELREYKRSEVVCFRKTNETFGGLSNMAPGFPLRIHGTLVFTSEALYQACRFPHMPDVQREIISQSSPMTAKMKSKPYRKESRADWDAVRVKVMRWCLRVKLAQHPEKFGELLRATDGKAIVEESLRDDFWGAKPQPGDQLIGQNVLGRLMMELRQWMAEHSRSEWLRVDPPAIGDFRLLGREIGLLEGQPEAMARPYPIFDGANQEPAKEPMPATFKEPIPGMTEHPARESVGRGIPKECKRLAEVDFPIAVVSKHAAREKSIRHGHPSTLHLWWARRPLASSRAVLLGLLWPDPCDPLCPKEFKAKAREMLPQVQGRIGTNDEDLRKALLKFIGDFANWDLAADRTYLEVSRALVKAAHGEEPPLVVDPFAGGGSIPLEALRLGCEAFASDLNPVACLILKVMLEDIPRHGAELAEELRRVGAEINARAEKELADLYPMDPDGAIPITYLWARTVLCESPNCGAEIPLIGSFWLCKNAKYKLALRHQVERPKGQAPHVVLEIFEPKTEKEVPGGLVRRAKASCVCCGAVLPPERVRVQLAAQRGGADVVFDGKGRRTGGARLLAVVLLRPAKMGRHYRLAAERDYEAVRKAQERVVKMLKTWQRAGNQNLCPVPDEPTPAGGGSGASRAFSVQRYGVLQWGDLFAARQKAALVTLASQVAACPHTSIKSLLALLLDRVAVRCTANCIWDATTLCIMQIFNQGQALPFRMEYAEMVPLVADGSGWPTSLDYASKVLEASVGASVTAVTSLADATEHPLPDDACAVWFTDPPYYDAVPYADLSDFFLVWLKRTLPGYPFLRDPFDPANPLAPKIREAVQDETKMDDGRPKDRTWFEEKMAKAFAEGRRVLNENGVGSVVFAHKTTEGWEALLSGLIRGGWTVTGSWPIATESRNRLRAKESAALATSVHLICRPRSVDAPVGDWAAVLRELPRRVGDWIERLQSEGVRGADLVFACIGPALEIYSRYAKVVDPEERQIPLGGDPEAREPHKRGYLAYVWETVGRTALENVLGTTEARARNGVAGALEEDARLTALFLWTLQSTNGDAADNASDEGDDEEAADDEAEDEEGEPRGTPRGFTLVFDVVRRFAQPLGIELSKWEGRVIETKKGVVRILQVAERAKQLFGEDGAQAVAARIEENASLGMQPQLALFPEEAAAPTIRGRRGRGRGRRSPQPGPLPDGEGVVTREATTLDRVHAAMLLQAGGRTNALRALLKAEKDRGPEFERLANALSALYPKGSEEKRLLDAMLLAVPR
jgi:putative DNA methylase